MMWIILGVVGVLVLCCCGGAVLTLGADNDGASSETSTSESVTTKSTEADDGETTASSPEESSSSSGTSSQTSESTSSSGPDHTVTAGDLIEEFEDNELAGDQKYKDKTIQVSGVVDNIDTEFLDEDKYLLNITDGGDFEFLSVTCHDMSNDVLAELTAGDQVTVIGDFDDGGDLGVDLKDCKVV